MNNQESEQFRAMSLWPRSVIETREIYQRKITYRLPSLINTMANLMRFLRVHTSNANITNSTAATIPSANMTRLNSAECERDCSWIATADTGNEFAE